MPGTGLSPTTERAVYYALAIWAYGLCCLVLWAIWVASTMLIPFLPLLYALKVFAVTGFTGNQLSATGITAPSPMSWWVITLPLFVLANSILDDPKNWSLHMMVFMASCNSGMLQYVAAIELQHQPSWVMQSTNFTVLVTHLTFSFMSFMASFESTVWCLQWLRDELVGKAEAPQPNRRERRDREKRARREVANRQ